MRFKLGDVVKLEGGERMTIGGLLSSRIAMSGYYLCHWFEGTTVCEDMFKEEDLQLVPEAEYTKQP